MNDQNRSPAVEACYGRQTQLVTTTLLNYSAGRLNNGKIGQKVHLLSTEQLRHEITGRNVSVRAAMEDMELRILLCELIKIEMKSERNFAALREAQPIGGPGPTLYEGDIY